MNLEVTTYAQNPDGTRSRQIDGFDDAIVIVRGERSAEIAEAIVARFSRQGPPRRPLGSGGCVRIDERGVWLLNKIETGWSSSAIRYETWRELLDEWDFTVGDPRTDKDGVYWPVERRKS